MPIGLVFMNWDDKAGTNILTKYPQTINVTSETLMQVVSTHEYSGESGMVSVMAGALNIASYYSGPESSYYLLLLLNLDDDPDLYEGGLADISRIILENIDDDAYIPMIPSLYRRLSLYPTLTREQSLAFTFQNEVKRIIFNRLKEEGVVSKSELMIWLKDKYRTGFFDLDGILLELIKQDIVKEASVKGMPSELVFLINDMLMFRIPPSKLLKDPVSKGLPEQYAEDYRASAKEFFLSYRPTEEDNLRLMEIFSNSQVYEVLRLLRTAIVTLNDIEKLKKKGVEDIDDVLKILWENKMIQTFIDEHGNEYYALLSDFHLNLSFPSHMLEVIRSEYNQKSKSNQVLIEYLTILEDTFLNLKDQSKYVE